MATKPFSWQCPFCGKYATITDENYFEGSHRLYKENKRGLKDAITTFVVCPNPECKELTFMVGLFTSERLVSGEYRTVFDDGKEQIWSLIPASQAKVFPEYVPAAIIADYVEACKILKDSPKASATLSRRCLQGMIRNFWGISKKTLFEEIQAIQDKVDPLTWQAIDAVRSIGNIGAHMEKDINLIIDVEPEEANKLIWLIETLIKEWYINRHEREENLERIIAVRQDKAQMKKQSE